MTTPTPYTRYRDYSDFQAENPDTELNGSDLDAEFDRVKTTTDSLATCLATIRKDDGTLKNQSVGVDQLKAEIVSLLNGITPRGDWLTATAYAVGDLVGHTGAYVCLVAHTSGTFATDLAAGKWMLLSALTAAASVGVTPTGGIASTDVQSALEELDSEKQPIDATLTALAAVATAANKLIYATGSDAFSTTDFTAAARALLDDATAAAMLATLGALAKDGSIDMTGLMKLSGNPTDPLHATTKQYVDAVSSAPRSYLAGLTLSTAGSSSTFSVAAGVATDSTNATGISLASALSKTTSAWAAGNANGALDTGAIATHTWYHVYVIKTTDGATTDVLLSTSATSPTMPAGYTFKRRIGAMKTDASSQFLAFTQDGDCFRLAASQLDVNVTDPGTAELFPTLNVPPGVRVKWLGNVMLSIGATPSSVYVSDPLATNEAPMAQGAAISAPGLTIGNRTGSSTSGTQAEVYTSTSGTIRYRVTGSAADVVVGLVTLGWIDRRGRDN